MAVRLLAFGPGSPLPPGRFLVVFAIHHIMFSFLDIDAQEKYNTLKHK
jgi:hypothetical protein